MATIQYWPGARVVIVKSFGQSDKATQDQVIQLDLTQAINIRTMRTVRNSPGTFSVSLFDKDNTLIAPDDPVTDIHNLFASSVSQKSIDTSQTVPSTKNSATANYYEFRSFAEWKAFEHIALEDPGTGIRLATFYRREAGSGGVVGDIIARWSIDENGNFLTIPPNADVYNDGDSITGILQDGKTRNFTVRKFANELMLTQFSPRLTSGRCKIAPMDRIVIFYTKRFVQNGNGYSIATNQHTELIRSFTGLVNRASVSYSEGRAMVEIEGEDITKYMRVALVNLKPAGRVKASSNRSPLDQNIITGYDEPVSQGAKFGGISAANMIRYLTLGMDGLVGMTRKEIVSGALTDQGVGQYNLGSTNAPQTQTFDAQTKTYQIKDNKGKVTDTIYTADISRVLGSLFQKSSVHVIDVAKFSEQSYQPYNIDTSAFTEWQGDYKPRRDLAYEIAEEINFVFYADRNGEIWFRPPRYSNQWILAAPNPSMYVLDDQSIISFSLIETDEQVVTNIIASTVGDQKTTPDDALKETGQNFATYQDNTLVMKYGNRLMVMHNSLIKQKTRAYMYFYAKNRLQQLLSERLQGSITITGRPEIDEGMPVFVPFLNMVYNAETVEDSMEVGGTFTTTVSLSHGRKPWDFIPEFLTYGKDLAGAFVDTTPSQKKSQVQSDQPQLDQNPDFVATPDLKKRIRAYFNEENSTNTVDSVTVSKNSLQSAPSSPAADTTSLARRDLKK